ncbi:VanZ family protein [Streptomyces sp. NPDC102274]|uniref:VanZ family protein n=1 Tax=Streptomyces sp. NPDC102274 TaxID=3366151 RepID=UPI00382BC08D
MTAEKERPKPAKAAPGAPGGIPWGRAARAVLRMLIMTVALVALTGFAAVLAELTLTPSPASEDIAGANLRPGHSLRQYAEDYTFLAACKQIGGNLLMGAPFGLILPVLVPRRLRLVRVVALTGVVTVLVELAQGAVVRGRAFDVDDVILNTGGAVIAYVLVGRVIGRRFHALGARGAAGAPGAGGAGGAAGARGAGAGASAGRKSAPAAAWRERLGRLGRR